MQVYIVAGGWDGYYMESTETLEKDGGSAWQVVASLPSARYGVQVHGLGLDNGRFMVTGECWTILCHNNLNSWCTAGGRTTDSLTHWTDEVLLYNSEEDEWTTVGHLSTARYYHGMSLVPANTVDHCL